MEGDGKVKFGYGVYLTSSFKSAAHYSETKSRPATIHYVYTVEVPDLTDDNHIDFKKPVQPDIIRRAELKLGTMIPDKFKLDGKDLRSVVLPSASCTSQLTCTKSRLANGKHFRKYLAKKFEKQICIDLAEGQSLSKALTLAGEK